MNHFIQWIQYTYVQLAAALTYRIRILLDALYFIIRSGNMFYIATLPLNEITNGLLLDCVKVSSMQIAKPNFKLKKKLTCLALLD